MHASMTDSLIQCWQLKRDVGFWRPSQAIPRAAEDGNRFTQPDPSWTPLLPQPNYSDYVSGHGCLTGPAVEVIRATLGERTALELRSGTAPPRVYRRLAAIEAAAESSRVWGGFHFRDAVADAYLLGHHTARRVLAALARP
jgi:hypothetical protein